MLYIKLYLVWDQWTDWSGCDVTCGGGVTSRSRNFKNGDVGDFGCDIGDASETADCENQDCPGSSNENMRLEI